MAVECLGAQDHVGLVWGRLINLQRVGNPLRSGERSAERRLTTGVQVINLPHKNSDALVRRDRKGVRCTSLVRQFVHRRELAELLDHFDHPAGYVVYLFFRGESAQAEADGRVGHIVGRA